MQRRVSLFVLVVLVLVWVGVPSDGQALAKGRTSGTSVSAATAQKLADGITRAASGTARAAALQTLFRTIKIGIYKAATGKAVSRGMETNVDDFYLASDEISTLADSFTTAGAYSAADLASLFTSAGIEPSGKAVDGQVVELLVRGTVLWAQHHPSSHAALLPLVIRDLGLKDSPRIDLATSAQSLDPIQFRLLALYYLAPIEHANSQTKGALQDEYGLCTIFKIAVNPFNPNSYLPDSAQVHTIIDGVIGGVAGGVATELAKDLGDEIAKDVAATGDKLSIAALVATALHGLYLAGALSVDTDTTELKSHAGPADSHSPDAGKKLVFKATVFMHAHINKKLQSCLHQAGYDIPDYGPVSGVPVEWQSYLSHDLSQYGSIAFDPADQKTSDGTGSVPKGVSTMTFTPRDEMLPGLGPLVADSGHVYPRALWGTAFGNNLGVINQAVTPMLGKGIPWLYTYHQDPSISLDWDLTWTVSGQSVQHPDAHTTITTNPNIAYHASARGISLAPQTTSDGQLTGTFAGQGAFTSGGTWSSTDSSTQSFLCVQNGSGNATCTDTQSATYSGFSASPDAPFAAQLYVDHAISTGSPAPPRLTLLLNPGSDKESVTQSGKSHYWDGGHGQYVDNSSTQTVNEGAANYMNGWSVLDQALRLASSSGSWKYQLTGWTYVGQGGVLATKHLTATGSQSDGISRVADITLTLRYTAPSSP